MDLHFDAVRMSTAALVFCFVILALTACFAESDPPARQQIAPTDGLASNELPGPRCHLPRVEYKPYPGHGEGLDQIPWVRGGPESSGLVALLWYWPEEWSNRHLREARIFTGGVAPAGYNVKILWTFLSPSAKGRGGGDLVVHGRRVNGPGSFRESFAAISHAGKRGAPSYASIIDVPVPGCWRLTLTTGELTTNVDFRAVRGSG